MTKREKFLSYFPVRPVYNYSHKEYIDKRGETIAFTITKDKTCETASVTRNGSETSSYKITLPDTDPTFSTPMFIHEMGHIIFQHLRFEKLKEDQTLDKFNAIWKTVKSHIKVPDGVNVTASFEKDLKRNVLKKFMNIAFDLEVNSKLFEPGEERKRRIQDREYFDARRFIKNMTTADEEDSFEKFLKEREKDPTLTFSKLVFPEDYHFQDNLNWFAYINLMIKNPDEFMNDLENSVKSTFEGSSENAHDGNGTGAGSKSSKDGYSQSSKLSTKFFESEGDLDKEIDKAIDAIRGIKSNDYFDRDTITPGFSKYGTGDIFVENALAANTRKMDYFIKKICVDNTQKHFHSDPLYNTNRGKVTSVCVPHARTHTSAQLGDVYILVDVSISVPKKYVEIIIDQIHKLKRFIGQNSRVIFWDVSLKNEYSIYKDPRIKVIAGGSTNMSTGIDYIKKKYLKHDNDKFLIISDFEDTLKDWEDSLEGVKNIYAVKWKSYNTIEDLKKEYSSWKNFQRIKGITINPIGD